MQVSSLNLQIDPRLIDIPFKPDGMLPSGYSESELYSAGAEQFPDSLLIPRGDWDHWIAEQDKDKSSALDFSARWTHQGGSHECVCHASVQAFEVAYNRQFSCLDYCFYGSPLALYTRITGGRQMGGSNVNDALREMMARGVLPEHDGPEWLGGKGGQAKRFKHTVHQTSGRSEDHWPTKGWIRESQFGDGWEDTARHFRVLKAFYIGNSQQHFSALLRGYGIVNGRGGHSIFHCKAVKSSAKYLSKYRDSYNRDLFDSEGMTGGGYAIAVVTMPADPLKPAGADMKPEVVAA
jgi:hypothetical protein